jgi:hypothetical protein
LEEMLEESLVPASEETLARWSEAALEARSEEMLDESMVPALEETLAR